MKTDHTQSMELEHDAIRDGVRQRYGSIARNEGGCCGEEATCCGSSSVQESPTRPQDLGYEDTDLAHIPAGAEMGLGCGNPLAIASIQSGEVILDLGSGGGFDCFLAAKQTGLDGRVIGVDMTPDMISKARQNARQAAYTNMEFRLGEIEALPVADATVDLIISNCVINLSPDKPRVFAEAFRVLKPGGRLAISDIVLLQPLPEGLKEDFEAYTGCVAGASTVDSLESELAAAGFTEVSLDVKPGSREFINQWVPGKNAGDYVASAIISARKEQLMGSMFNFQIRY